MNIKLPDNIKPLTWKLLKTFHRNPPNCPFPRSNTVIQSYRKHKDGLELINSNASDFVKQQYFSEKNASKVSCLTDNKFPYLLEPGIQHKVLWFNHRITMSKQFPRNLNTSPGFIEVCLSKKMPDIETKYEILYFENLDQCRSIPGVRHIQVFLKEKELTNDINV